MFPTRRQIVARRIIVITTCLAGAGTSGYFLYLDLSGNASRQQGPVIAEVTRKVSRVRRKPRASFLWESVKEGSSLVKKDSLQVGEASAATVKLANNAILEVGENSLVIIDDVPPLEMKFLKGKFILRGDKNDYRIEAEENKAPVIRPLSVRLLSPGAHQSVYTLENKPTAVLFEWLELQKSRENIQATNPRVEVSRSPTFSARSMKTFPVKPGRSMLQASLAPGRYYWRFNAANVKDPETRAFQVRVAHQLTPISPPDNTTLQRLAENQSVEFRWPASRVPFATPPRLQVARRDDFAGDSMVVNEAVVPESGRFVVDTLPSGRFYWRLSAVYPQFEANSKTRSFQIVSAKEIPLTLAFPSANEEQSVEKPLRFGWEFGAEGGLFEFQLDRFTGESEVQPVARERLNAAAYEWTKPEAGRYRWRVAAIYGEKILAESNWREVKVVDSRPIALNSPSDNAKLFYWTATPEFALEWENEPAPSGSRYQVRLAAEPSFGSSTRTFTPEQNFLRRDDLNINDGTYYWQVQLRDGTGQVLKKSQIRRFTVSVYPPLPAPKEIFPKNNQAINIVKRQKDPELRWNALPDATEYEVRLLDNRGREIASATTSETSYALKEIKQGKYRWTVRAVDPLKRPGRALAGRFSIVYGEQLNAPEIVGSKVE